MGGLQQLTGAPERAASLECVKCGHKNRCEVSACARCTWPFAYDAWQSTRYTIRRITVDKNCVNARQLDPHLNTLEQWGSAGLLQIQRSDIFLRERESNAARLAKGRSIPAHPHPFVFDKSILGGGDVLAGPDLADAIRSVLFPTTHVLTQSQENDVEHLRQHVRAGGDVFVTNDKGFIKNGKQVELCMMGVWVLVPREVVELLSRLYGWVR